LDSKLQLLAYVIAGLALFGELAVLVVNVIFRTGFNYSFSANQELARVALNILTFVGGAIAYRAGMHMPMSFMTSRVSPALRAVLGAFSHSVVLVTAVAAALLSIPYLRAGWSANTEILHIPLTLEILPYTLGMTFLAVFAIRHLLLNLRRSTVLTTFGVIAIAVGLTTVTAVGGPLITSDSLPWLMVALFLIMLPSGVPIGFVLACTAIVSLLVSDIAFPVVVPQRMIDGADNFILLAVPFFVFVGIIMSDSGVSKTLADVMKAIVGRIRGGYLQVIVITMYFFSGISGAKTADMVAVGAPLSDILDERGYSREETAAVLAASAVMGETIPPSIGLLVLGSITTLSIAELFVAGIVPAAVLAIVLMLAIYIRARRIGMPVESGTSLKEASKALIVALPSLALPVMLVFAIIRGIATPTEVSAIAVVYGLLLALVLHRMSRTALLASIRNSINLTGMVLFVVSAAYPFSWVLTVMQIPQTISQSVSAFTGVPWLFMLATVLVLVVLGSLLEGLPALIIFAPLLVPVAAKMGISPIQYGIVLLISLGLGAFTPPLGIGFYVAAAITKARVDETVPRLLLYLGILLIGVVLLALVPPLTLSLPHLVLGK
jgi:tripartite ATP-independent transporter DctM subunit